MNELQHIADFEKTLAGYTLSTEAKKVLDSTRLVLLVGPSSSGRNTIINELVRTGDYHFIVSDTTRQPRTNNGVAEQSGREYWFRSEEDVLGDLKKGLFLEAAIIHHQQVSGMSIRELERAADRQKIAINEIEVVGADNIHAAKPDGLFLFVVPPSFEEWLVRMSARGPLPASEMQRRLKSAVFEIRTALSRDFYHFVVNDTFMLTTKKVQQLIRDEAQDEAEETRGREVAAKLLADTERYLENLAQ